MFHLIRDVFTKDATHGKLYWNGDFVCYTLEDVARPKGVKVKRETAIPEGLYEITISISNRFKTELPEILDVPQFTGIRMHGGNTIENTEGCPLVAHNRILGDDKIYKKATAEVLAVLRSAGGKSYIKVENLTQNG